MAYKHPPMKMRKIILLLLLSLSSTIAFGQNVTVEDLNEAIEKEMKSKSSDYNSFAKTIMQEIPLDNKGGFTYINIVEAPGKTKDQLYIALNAWFLRNFDGKGIQINDKDLGCILAKETFRRITANGVITSSNTNYEVDIEPSIRTDIKDGKVRITYNVPYYELRDVTSELLGKQIFKKKQN